MVTVLEDSSGKKTNAVPIAYGVFYSYLFFHSVERIFAVNGNALIISAFKKNDT